jgi:Tfp pilus assembly protein PilX
MKSITLTAKSNEAGYVLVITLFLLLMLTVIGIAATRTSIVEMRISGNHKKMVQDFYAAEGAIIAVLENSDWWLGDDFLNGGERVAGWSGELDIDGDGTKDAFVEVRCVEPSKSNIAALSRAANRVPADRHIAPCPVNSGYSTRHFTIRKYAVTAMDLNAGVSLQSGAWKVFSKF